MKKGISNLLTRKSIWINKETEMPVWEDVTSLNSKSLKIIYINKILTRRWAVGVCDILFLFGIWSK